MDHLGSHLLGFRGEVGVERGGLGGVVTEILLDETKVDASLQQVCGVRMSQRMNRGFFDDAALVKGQAKRILNVAEGCGSFGGGAMNATASGSRENPDGVGVSFPVLAKQLQG